MMVEKFEEDKIALAVSMAWSLWVNRSEIQHGGRRKGRAGIGVVDFEIPIRVSGCQCDLSTSASRPECYLGATHGFLL